MIEILDKTKCSGCTACFNVCPKDAIEMIEDEEGFLYPKVDKEKCIKCGLCSRICPNKKKMNYTEFTSKAYATYYKENEKIRKESTSGGAFTAIAEEIIKKKGIVFGVGFDDEFNVEHMWVDNKEELYKFRGSKYVQSNIRYSYRDVKKFLKQGKYVLFSGTPCQISGLKAFLNEDYEKLYCIEVFCKGVPTPKVWRKYLEDKEKNGSIKQIRFREKTFGYHSTTMTIRYKSGKKYSRGHESDPMLNLFVKEMISRPSCYNCNFRGKRREADFTIGDLWYSGNIIKEYKEEENKGVSILLINSEKAKNLLKNIKQLETKEIDLERGLQQNANKKNCALINDCIPNDKRKKFFQDLSQMSYNELIKKYTTVTLKCRIKLILKPILYRMNILELVKK